MTLHPLYFYFVDSPWFWVPWLLGWLTTTLWLGWKELVADEFEVAWLPALICLMFGVAVWPVSIVLYFWFRRVWRLDHPRRPFKFELPHELDLIVPFACPKCKMDVSAWYLKPSVWDTTLECRSCGGTLTILDRERQIRGN